MTDDVISGAAQSRLRSIVERLERLEEDKAAVGGDLKEVYAEAKGEGFDAKILRKVVRLRKMDRAKRQEEAALLDLYLAAIEGTAEAPPAVEPPRAPRSRGEDIPVTIRWRDHQPVETTTAILTEVAHQLNQRGRVRRRR